MSEPAEQTGTVTCSGIIFDMDGVVVDSVGYWNDVRRRVLTAELGLDDVDVSDLVGMNASDEYDYLDAVYELDWSHDAYVSRIHDAAAEIYGDRVALLEGFEDCLVAARRQDVPVGLVSAAYRRRVDLVVERFELAPTLDVILGGDEVPGPSKPDPAIYEQAVEDLGVPPSSVVAVEDSAHGVAAATGAGVYCLGYDHHAGQTLSAADERFESAAGLTTRLRSLLESGELSAGTDASRSV